MTLTFTWGDELGYNTRTVVGRGKAREGSWDMREISKMVGLLVIASEEGANLGRVTEVIVDLAQGVMVGLIIGEEPVEKGILVEDIGVIGPHAVMVPDASQVKDIGDLPQLTEKRRGSTEQMITVMTESGAKLGTLAEVFIDPEKRTITRYEVSGGTVRDLTDGTLSLPVVAGIVHGRDTIIIPDSAVAELIEPVGGLKGAWATALSRLKQEYEVVSDKAGHLYKDAAKGGKVALAQAKQRSEKVAHAVSEKVEQAREAMEAEQEPSSEEKDQAPEEIEGSASADAAAAQEDDEVSTE
jgi:uncharacterized protein YrrD